MNRKRTNIWLAGLLMFGIATAIAAKAADTQLRKPQADTEQAIAAARGLSTAFRTVSEELLPSVVAIETSPQKATWKKPSKESPSTSDENPFKGTPFEDMFRGRKSETPPRKSPSPRQGGIGSGVIIDAAGIVLTNNHVVAGGGDVKVRLHDGREFDAVDVWTDPKTDIAVLRIENADNLVAAKIGDSDSTQIGDWALALGQPFGLESTVTAGIISAKHRGIGLNARENYLQTDAAINPGNSGGPLVNLDGEIVGINTAISSRSGGNDGIGFAVPINLAKWISDQLLTDGKVHRAYLGVGIQPVTHDLAKQLNVKPREGVVVTDVFPDTPAANTGLQAGDVIVEFGGKSIGSPQELQIVVERAKTGETHPLRVVRDGKSLSLAFSAEEQPSDFGVKRGTNKESTDSSRLDKLGMEVSPLTESVAKGLGLNEVVGVVITAVRSDGPAANAGLRSGMVIIQANRKSVSSVADLTAAMAEDTVSGLLLLVKTLNGSRFVVIDS